MDMNVPIKPVHVMAAIYYPLQTVKCVGSATFKNQSARDYACLLDVDDDVVECRCLPQLEYRGSIREADFLVTRCSQEIVVDVILSDRDPPVTSKVPTGYGHQAITASDFSPTRLRNAKDLIRYATYRVSLSDRVRLLAALDQEGSLSVAECLSIFMDTRPIAGLAHLVLSRFVEIDLDTALIGPETQVRRKRD